MINIIFIGLISFFADVSTEMVYPLIPLYLTGRFGASPALIGIIEGIAESIASLLKVFSGYLSDRYKKKKPIAFLGYSSGLFYKLALLLATSWFGILAARVIDRIGKGIRTAPRDVMVSDSADEKHIGKAFGIHKALDMAGSALGILLAFLFLIYYKQNGVYKNIFLYSMIPAVLSLIMFLFVKEKKEHRSTIQRIPFWKNIAMLDRNLKLYILVAFLFTLGNSSNAFLLLRAKSTGFDDTTVVLLYFIYNITASLLSIPLGSLSDKVGRRKVLIGGYLTFAIVYLGFAFAFNQLFMIAMFVLYGLYTAMIAGVERAYISEIAPPALKGTMLGLHSTAVGVALLPASAIAGILWTTVGTKAPFFFGSLLSFLAAALLFLFLKPQKLSIN